MPNVLYERRSPLDTLTDKWEAARISLRSGVYVGPAGVQGVLEICEIRKGDAGLETRTRLEFTSVFAKVPLYGRKGDDLRRIMDTLMLQAGAFHTRIADQQRKKYARKKPKP